MFQQYYSWLSTLSRVLSQPLSGVVFVLIGINEVLLYWFL